MACSRSTLPPWKVPTKLEQQLPAPKWISPLGVKTLPSQFEPCPAWKALSPAACTSTVRSHGVPLGVCTSTEPNTAASHTKTRVLGWVMMIVVPLPDEIESKK